MRHSIWNLCCFLLHYVDCSMYNWKFDDWSSPNRKVWNVSFCSHSYFLLLPCLRWKNCRPLSADGNYRPMSKTRQQQNISMRRQENFRWISELSYVEEKEQWQEQINQLKKQLEFSVSICQTLMQDQQVGMKSS